MWNITNYEELMKSVFQRRDYSLQQKYFGSSWLRKYFLDYRLRNKDYKILIFNYKLWAFFLLALSETLKSQLNLYSNKKYPVNYLSNLVPQKHCLHLNYLSSYYHYHYISINYEMKSIIVDIFEARCFGFRFLHIYLLAVTHHCFSLSFFSFPHPTPPCVVKIEPRATC
jgi:hypothetical protein